MPGKDRPILFSTPMVQALLAGKKWQTRRIIKFDMHACLTGDCPHILQKQCDDELASICPYGQPGDALWVRESFAPIHSPGDQPPGFVYKASERAVPRHTWKYKPSIHMPRIASRLTLPVLSVHAERLNDISEADALAEGCDSGWLDDAMPARDMGDGYTISSPGTFASAAGNYQILWDKINGEGSWETDPWVWVIEFKVMLNVAGSHQQISKAQGRGQ